MKNESFSQSTKRTIEVTDKELYVLRQGLQEMASIDDDEYINFARIASNLLFILPASDAKWSDVQA